MKTIIAIVISLFMLAGFTHIFFAQEIPDEPLTTSDIAEAFVSFISWDCSGKYLQTGIYHFISKKGSTTIRVPVDWNYDKSYGKDYEDVKKHDYYIIFKNLDITKPSIKFLTVIDQCGEPDVECPFAVESEIEVISRTKVKLKQIVYVNMSLTNKENYTVEFIKK